MTIHRLARKLVYGIGLSAVMLLTGCFETTDEFTINPDGSGKVVHECRFVSVDIFNQNSTTEERLRGEVRRVIEKSKGVEVWQDVSFRCLDDGRVFFRGTAYFRRLSELEIAGQSVMKFAWRKDGTSGGVLELAGRVARTNEAPATAKLSAEEEAEKMKQDRMKFQQMKPMFAAFINNLRHEASFHLPGKVRSSSNFETDRSGAMKIAFEGTRFLAALETGITNNEWLSKHRIDGLEDLTKPADLADAGNGLMFGTKGPVRVVMTGDPKPLFDYAAEVAVAHKDFARVQKELGVAAASVPPAQGGSFKNLKVVGFQLVRPMANQPYVRPFDYATPGFRLAVLGELPGRVLEITQESEAETAIADDGTSLLPDSKNDRSIGFQRLYSDNTAVLFEIRLKPPGPGIRSLKELSGHLQYKAGKATNEVDLGFSELKAGAKGTLLGAEIRSVDVGLMDNSRQMQLRLNLNPSDFKSMSILSEGTRLPLRKRACFGGSNVCTFTFETLQPFPPKGTLLLEVAGETETFDIPFKLENVSLLGERTLTAK